MATKFADTDSRVREHFDDQMALYVDCHREKHLTICAERIELLEESSSFRPQTALRLLDMGCGAGYLSDAFLRKFAEGKSIGVDVSIGMLSRNARDARKLLLVADARAIPFHGDNFDVINFDTVLHHIIHPDGYSSTIAGITALLQSLRPLLNRDGRIMIREIYHESWGWKSLGCRVLHMLTTMRLPKPLAALVQKCGIHTANVGVCFLTRKQWLKVFDEGGLRVVSMTDHRWPSPLRYLGVSSGEVYYYLAGATSR